MCDSYSKHSVQAWMHSYLRILYMMTVFCGSAFAAVDICNSNLFHLSVFNMGLNKRQKATFKNQRVLSTVLMENFPQLILQIIYLGLTRHDNISAIAIIAMIFSVISIISSIFDYKSSSVFIACESITVIEMNIESQQLSNTKRRKFDKMIVHHRKSISREMSKILRIDWRLIEILMPIQTNTGAQLVFYIRNNDPTEKNLSSTMVNTIRDVIVSGELAQVMLSILLEFGTFFNDKQNYTKKKHTNKNKNT